MLHDILSIAAVAFGGVNTVLILRLIFRAGEWYGEVNTRLDTQDREFADQAARLDRLEKAVDKLVLRRR